MSNECCAKCRYYHRLKNNFKVGEGFEESHCCDVLLHLPKDESEGWVQEVTPQDRCEMYEEKDHIADADKMIEPTTKNDLGVDWESYKDVDGNSLDDLILEVLQNNFDCGNTYGYKVADEIIELLPSVTPQEPRWIPCSERLPEPVNVGALWKREVLITGYLSFDDKKKRFVATEHIDNVISKKDVNDVHVVAWMPLPKSYEPQKSEDKE